MEIIKATVEYFDSINEIYGAARKYMRRNGNPEQWKDSYPSNDQILSDIAEGSLYLVMEEGSVLAVFYCAIGPDVAYSLIEDGEWLNDEPYAVIHRIAVSDSARGRGISRICFDFACEKSENLRIDTHKDNLPMQAALARYGFVRCGKVYVRDGGERVAFQYTRRRCDT